MAKFFNTAGLCNPDKHYMVDPMERLSEIENLLEAELYFTIHAPRQTGKTTLIHALTRRLNNEGRYIALTVSFESAGFKSITEEKANLTLIYSIYQAARFFLTDDVMPADPKENTFHNIKDYLTTWCTTQSKPIVLFIDEIDALFDDVLISVLRQLRDGYQHRPKGFPGSVALVGLRDVREYRAQTRPDSKSLGTASPFNIKAESIFLSNFTREQVFGLLDQHTNETGQKFENDVKEAIFHLSNGQPWLVNALANQIVNKILKNDYTQSITIEHVNQAREALIRRRDTHLDSLVDKLKETRVKNVVQSIINGEQITFDSLDDDISYVRDLGLISQTSPLSFTNPIYAEIITRIMSSPIEVSIPGEIQPPWFVKKDGGLDMEKLLKQFQKFYRRHSDAWLDRYTYKESAHHLLLMAFLQRVINGGGRIVREMALGNQRIDLCVVFGKQEFALELKINRHSYTLEDGKEQLTAYLDKLGLDEGYLILFEMRDKSWEERIYYKQIEHAGKRIWLVGM